MIVKTADITSELYKEIDKVSKELKETTDLELRKVLLGKRIGLREAIAIIQMLEPF
jgi:hypothetical protein